MVCPFWIYYRDECMLVYHLWVDVTGLSCFEFVTTWVRSGVFMGPEGLSVPSEVLLTEPVPGLHVLHLASTVDWSTQAWSSVVEGVVSAQPLDVRARTVDAPPASVVGALDLAGAIARADALRLPVHVPGDALARSGVHLRVLPFDASGRPADAVGADYVLVLPETDLVAGRISTTGSDLKVASRAMPDLLRLVGDRVEVGLPQPIVNALFTGTDLTTMWAGETRSVAGGVHGLWRALATLESGSAVRIHATTADAFEVLVAIRAPMGLALLRDSADVQAADLPRTPVALSVTPVSVLNVAANDSVIRPGDVAAALGGVATVSKQLAQAVGNLPAWTKNAPDCVVRVDAVLRDYGLPTVREDTSRPIDVIAGRLGGRFQPSVLQRLDELAPGALTVVRVDYPDQRPHLVVIERQRDDTFTVVETEPRDNRVLTSFTRDDLLAHLHPERLVAPIALPIRPDGRLCQANETGLLSTGPAATTTGTASAAVLVDPVTGSAGMPPSRRGGNAVASDTTQPSPAYSVATGLTDDVIKNALNSMRQDWNSLSYAERIEIRRWLRRQADIDGGWSDSWPIRTYLSYFGHESSKSQSVPTLDPAVTRALIEVLKNGASGVVTYVYLLRRDPTRVTQLRRQGWQAVVQTREALDAVRADPSVFDAAMSDPVLEEYILGRWHRDRFILQRYPTLYTSLGNDAKLFHTLAGSAWGSLAGEHPTLCEFLRTADDKHQIARRVSVHAGLALVLLDRPMAQKTAEWWGSILRNTELLHDLDRHQGALRALMVPNVFEAVAVAPAHRRALLELLSQAPGLADVLVEAPSLMQRLATSGGLAALRAAVKNPTLVPHLSLTPGAYDQVADAELAAKLGETQPTPAWWDAQPATLGPGMPTFRRAIASNPGLGALLSSKRPVPTSIGDVPPDRLLLTHQLIPSLLAERPLGLMPHEHHRLMKAVAADRITTQPLPDVAILRIMINHPSTAKMLDGDHTVSRDELNNLATAEEQYSVLIEAMRTNPALVDAAIYTAQVVRNHGAVPLNEASNDSNYSRLLASPRDRPDLLYRSAYDAYVASPDLVALSNYNPSAEWAIGKLAAQAEADVADQGFVANFVGRLRGHRHLLVALAALPLLDDVGWRHWAALFSNSELMADLNERLAGGGAEARVAREVLASDVLAPFLELADPRSALAEPRLAEALRVARGREGRVVAIGGGVFERSRTRDGIPATAAGFALAEALAQGLDVFARAIAEFAQAEDRHGLFELHGLLGRDSDVREAVVGNLPLAVLAVENPRVAALLRDRPMVRSLAVKEAVTRSLLHDAKVVEALRTNDRFHAIFVDMAEAREAFDSQVHLLPALFGNAGLLRASVDPDVLFHVIDSSAASRVVLTDSHVADALAAHQYMRETLSKAGLLALNWLSPLPQEVRRAVVTSRAIFTVFQEDPQGVGGALTGRPVVVAGLNSRVGLLSEAAHVRRLLENSELLDLIEQRVPDVNDALFGTDGVLIFVAARPELTPILAANPWLATLLTHKSVRTLVKAQSDVVGDLVASRNLREVVVLPGVAEALKASGRVTAQLRDRPDLVDALKRNRLLMTRLGKGGAGPHVLWQALVHDPHLARQLHVAGMRALERNTALLAALSVEGSGLTDGEWKRLLNDDAAIRELNASAGEGLGAVALAGQFRSRLAPAGSSRPVLAASAETAAQQVEEVTVDPVPVGSWLDEVPHLLLKLQTPDGADLAQVLRRSPDLLYLLRSRADLAGLVADEPGRAVGYTFGSYLDGDGRGVSVFEQAAHAWAAEIGIPLDSTLEHHARDVWNYTIAQRRAAEALALREAHRRRARLNPFDYTKWELTGEVRYGGVVTADDFDDENDVKNLRKIAATGGGAREGTGNLALNAARHAHLQGGDHGVTFAFVVNAQWRVDLLVYTRSERRKGNDYLWRGNGMRYTNKPAPLAIALADETLTASKERVRERANAADAVAQAPHLVSPPTLSNPLGEALYDYHLAYTSTSGQTESTATATGAKKKKKIAVSATADPTPNSVTESARETVLSALRDFGVTEPVGSRDVAGEPTTAGAEAVNPPSWTLRLPPSIITYGNVHIISSHPRPEPNRLIQALVGAADADHPVIVLGASMRGQDPPLESDRRTLNYLLEQFAQRAQLPLVVTRGTITDELLNVVGTYGAALLHPTQETTTPNAPQRPLQADNRWKATARRRNQTVTSASVWEDINIGVLRAAAELARPTEAVTRIDDKLGELIWATDLTTARAAFTGNGWSATRMRSALAEVKQMTTRVPDQPALSVFAPILEFGTTGHANIVFDYALADNATKPRVLLNAVGALEQATQLDTPTEGGLTTVALASMVTAVDVSDVTHVSAEVLKMIGLIKDDKFTNAFDFIQANSGRLNAQQKGDWVDAITNLQRVMTDKTDQLEELARGVLECAESQN